MSHSQMKMGDHRVSPRKLRVDVEACFQMGKCLVITVSGHECASRGGVLDGGKRIEFKGFPQMDHPFIEPAHLDQQFSVPVLGRDVVRVQLQRLQIFFLILRPVVPGKSCEDGVGLCRVIIERQCLLRGGPRRFDASFGLLTSYAAWSK